MALRRALSVSLAVWVATLATPAVAQQDDPSLRSAGRKLAQDGVTLLQQSHPEQASEKLEKAYQLLQVPSVALWSARALVARGLLVEAAERYVEAGRLSGFKGDQQVQLQAQKDAARELEVLTPRIPTLVIAVPLDSTERPVVTLDGKPVPTALLGEEQPVNPGAHEIKVSFGAKLVTRSVSLQESEKKHESITSDQAAPSSASDVEPAAAGPAPAQQATAHPGSTRRTLSFVALAAGGAGLIVGGVTGALAISKHGSLDDRCGGSTCPPGAQSDVDGLNTLRSVSTIGFIAGGVLATTGLVLLLTDKPTSPSAAHAAPRLALRVSPSALGLSGAF